MNNPGVTRESQIDDADSPRFAGERHADDRTQVQQAHRKLRVEAGIALRVGRDERFAGFEHALNGGVRGPHLVGIERGAIQSVHRREVERSAALVGDHHEAALRAEHVDGDVQDAAQHDVEFERTN